jgi:DNA-binding response OmpR family regulator
VRLLLAEDDGMIGASLHDALFEEGYAVDWVIDGQAADSALLAQHYDAVVLDLGLPKRPGIDVLRALRNRRNRIPVLILTARDAVSERVAGLDAGADDYLTKPFDLDELLARLRALIRRASGRAEPAYDYAGVVLDPVTREARIDGRPLALLGREWAVLEALLARPGAVLSRAQLEEKLYGWDQEVGSNTVEVYIHSLRKKLGHGFIKNVRGLGYFVDKPPG